MLVVLLLDLTTKPIGFDMEEKRRPNSSDGQDEALHFFLFDHKGSERALLDKELASIDDSSVEMFGH